MDRCLKVEHARYLGRMHWLGFNTGESRPFAGVCSAASLVMVRGAGDRIHHGGKMRRACPGGSLRAPENLASAFKPALRQTVNRTAGLHSSISPPPRSNR